METCRELLLLLLLFSALLTGFLCNNDGNGMSFEAADGTFSPHDESLNQLLFNLGVSSNAEELRNHRPVRGVSL